MATRKKIPQKPPVETARSAPAEPAPARAEPPAGPTFVCIELMSGSGCAVVEAIREDGRARVENGRTKIVVGVRSHFILSPEQSVRVVAD